MSHYKPYPAYKDSGVEWLGRVPEHWDIKRARYLFDLAKRPAAEGDGIVTAFRDGQVTLRTNRRTDGFTNALKEIGYQGVRVGDLVIHAMDAFAGAVGVSDSNGKCSPVYSCCTPRNGVNSRFYARLVRTMSTTGFIESLAKGIRERSTDFRWGDFSNLVLPLPTEAEQQRIAEQLDRETARIDALIDKKTRFIELLREKRQTLITHAVTKGLDPNARMKDSGVEWLGEVPEHWRVMAIKLIVANPITDGPHETPAFLDEGVPFVSAEAVSSGRVDFAKIRGYISRDDHERYSQKYCPKRGDIFMIKSGATTGVTAIVETDDEFNIWSPLAVIRCGEIADPYFVLNFMRSRSFQEAVALNWSYGTQQNIGMGVIGNLAVTVPPLDEQKRIAHSIQTQCGRLGALIDKTEYSIDLLKERRTALITAAVTGQIDLREAV